ncbi:SDR family NAD(P)-dependent oxidoreductase [Longivirga aurantiaca]|uniref:SDR family NAD(P)-dependent oxidoreductase n=1 Tax=Longivirga aurantiaca TaxID=1837743 RepID=A0ABW1SYP1_9ACTN
MTEISLGSRLAGRTAVVTGAASGNGLGIAVRLLAEGASVAFVDRDAQRLDEVVPSGDARALAVPADVTDEASMHDMVASVVESFGSLDVLVNNAGIVRFSDFDDLEIAEWEEVFRVNSTGAFLAAKAAVPAMKSSLARREGTGAIVNITSTEAHVVLASAGHPQVHYNASKGALHMFNQGLAIELGSSRIRVNAVAPGIVETPFTARAMQDERLLNWYLDRIPLGRVAQPADVAAAVAYLASEDASYVTGTTLFVDGGWTAQ